MTRPESRLPAQPDFRWERLPSVDLIPQVKIIWEPNPNKRNAEDLGSSFYAQYRRVGETDFKQTKTEDYEEFIVVPLADGGDQYEFKITAIDGNLFTESETKIVDLSEGPLITRNENVATAGWFIGMMLAIAFLLLVLIMVCILKRNRGGKYAVHEREQANGRHDYPDEGGFHEYSQP